MSRDDWVPARSFPVSNPVIEPTIAPLSAWNRLHGCRVTRAIDDDEPVAPRIRCAPPRRACRVAERDPLAARCARCVPGPRAGNSGRRQDRHGDERRDRSDRHYQARARDPLSRWAEFDVRSERLDLGLLRITQMRQAEDVLDRARLGIVVVRMVADCSRPDEPRQDHRPDTSTARTIQADLVHIRVRGIVEAEAVDLAAACAGVRVVAGLVEHDQDHPVALVCRRSRDLRDPRLQELIDAGESSRRAVLALGPVVAVQARVRRHERVVRRRRNVAQIVGERSERQHVRVAVGPV